MIKDGAIKDQIIQKEDIFVEHLNQKNNQLKNEEFFKGSLETFDKFFNEEEIIKTNKKPVNLSIDNSTISNTKDFSKLKEKIINGGKDKNFSFNMNTKNEKNVEINQMKKQLFNTLQSYESVEDLKKKKLFSNRESAKRSRLKKKQYVENLEKEFLFLKQEIIRIKSLQKFNSKNINIEFINNSVSNNNIINSVIMDNINFNFNINNPKDKEIMNLKKEELHIISNNLTKDSKTVNNYINKQKKLLQNCLIKQIEIIIPTEIKNFQNKFLKIDEIKKDDSISIIKNKITRNLEVIKDLYDIEIIPETDKNNSLKIVSKVNNIYNFYKDLKSYVEQYELIYNNLHNLSE